MNKISNAIKCVNCKQVLTSPVMLPCGCSICKKHTRDNEHNNGVSLILCCKCEIEHPLPSNGHFLPNTALAEIVEAQIGALDLGQTHVQAKQSCQQLDELLTNIETILRDPFNYTYEAIKCLKDVVQLKGEEIKLQIDAQMNRLQRKLDEYNEACKKAFETNEYLVKSEKIRVEKDKGRQVLDIWLSTLNEVKLNEREWEKVKGESQMAIERFETALDLFKRDLLLRKFGNFRDEIKRIFGKFEIDPMFNLG